MARTDASIPDPARGRRGCPGKGHPPDEARDRPDAPRPCPGAPSAGLGPVRVASAQSLGDGPCAWAMAPHGPRQLFAPSNSAALRGSQGRAPRCLAPAARMLRDGALA
eukprot:976939-Pyramimonas_sp.AAC.1